MQFKSLSNIFPVDKLLHVLCGIVIALIVVGWFNPIATLCAVLGVAILKEGYDFFSKIGTVEGKDILATMIGGGIGLAINFLHVTFPYQIG